METENRFSHDFKNMIFEYSFSDGIYTWISVDICSNKEKLKISDELKRAIFAFTTLEDERTFPAREKRNKFIREKLKEFEEMKSKYPEIKLKKYLPESPHLIIPLSPQIIGNQKDTDEYVKYIDTQLKNLEELSGSVFCEEVLNFYILLSNLWDYKLFFKEKLKELENC